MVYNQGFWTAQNIYSTFSQQVVTLSSDGKVTWWVVVRVPPTNAVLDIGIGKKSSNYSAEEGKVGVSPHMGAAPWARIALNRASTIDVATTLYGWVI